jgi:alkaline phosphatase D
MPRRSGAIASAYLALALGVLATASDPVGRGSPSRITHGPLVGDVTATAAHVWARGGGPGTLVVSLLRADGRPEKQRRARLRGDADFTAVVPLKGLSPGRAYAYRVSIEGETTVGSGRSRRGTFRTAPAPNQRSAVRIAIGGDLAGQNLCRDAREGFAIFKALVRDPADFFLGLGDMIYADDVCGTVGRYGNPQVPGDHDRAATLADYQAHWRYTREDRAFARLLASRGYLAVWDDHEVVNDFGPLHDTRDEPPYVAGEHLLPLGLAAFLAYNPISSARPPEPTRLHRSLRFGRHLELFLLDTRQYRDANRAPDTAETPKSLLGTAQRAWLEQGLAASDATWKLVVSSVPISIPTGFPPANGRDGWANFDQDTGFERELEGVLRTAERAGVRNLVFLTTDVHHAEVIRYVPFDDAPAFVFHEMVTGPLSAILSPLGELDPSFRPERLFGHAPESSRAVQDYATAKRFFNYGSVEVSADGELALGVHDVSGALLYALAPPPAGAAEAPPPRAGAARGARPGRSGVRGVISR